MFISFNKNYNGARNIKNFVARWKRKGCIPLIQAWLYSKKLYRVHLVFVLCWKQSSWSYGTLYIHYITWNDLDIRLACDLILINQCYRVWRPKNRSDFLDLKTRFMERCQSKCVNRKKIFWCLKFENSCASTDINVFFLKIPIQKIKMKYKIFSVFWISICDELLGFAPNSSGNHCSKKWINFH